MEKKVLGTIILLGQSASLPKKWFLTPSPHHATRRLAPDAECGAKLPGYSAGLAGVAEVEIISLIRHRPETIHILPLVVVI